MHIQAHFPLHDYNTFHIDACARYFVEIDKQSDIRALRSDPVLAALPWYVLGEGSNILLTRDLEGVVVRNRFRQLRVMKEDDESLWVSVGGGMHWHDLVTWSVNNNLWGLENLALIPGTVGAAPVQNIGAYGTEVQDLITRVQALDLFTGERHEFRNADCQFSYRSSIFKREYRNQMLIHRATFRLRKLEAGHANLVYDPLREALADIPENKLTPRHVYKTVIRLRREKLPDPDKEGNAGSFFKNPVVDEAYFAVLQEKWPDLPHHHLPGGGIKVPAAWLIEQCGWKGRCLEGTDACVSSKHALVLVNRGHATGEQILTLAKAIQTDVMHLFGIHLEPEVIIL